MTGQGVATGRLLPKGILATLLATGVLFYAPLAVAQQNSLRPTTEWSISTPEEQDMSSKALASLVDFGQANNMNSLLVVRHGRIVLEATLSLPKTRSTLK